MYNHYLENGKVVLEIQDNGLGIDLARHGDKLFGMYKTFHKNENARGIGLFITKNQIESMGGSVTVDSKTNKGTTFKIYFNNEI
jgi:sensor histidine kinase regulating citrate/malate metabolism